MGIFSRIFNRPNPDGSPASDEGSADASATEQTDAAEKSDANAAAPAPDEPSASEPAPGAAATGRGAAKKVARPIGPLELSESEFPPKARRRTPRPKRRASLPDAPALPPPAPLPVVPEIRAPQPPAVTASKLEMAPTVRARPPAGGVAPRVPPPVEKPAQPTAPSGKPAMPLAGGMKPGAMAPPGGKPEAAAVPAPNPRAPVVQATKPGAQAAQAAKPVNPPAGAIKPVEPPVAAAPPPPPDAPFEQSVPPSSRRSEDPEASLAAELDSWFAVSRRHSSLPPPPEGWGAAADGVTTADDMHNVRELFNEMAVHYTGQLREFMLELRRADTTASWVALCDPAVRQLRTMCDTLGMPELSRALEKFASLFDHAKDLPEGVVQGGLREQLLVAYDQMVALLPRAFELSTGREKLLVQLLLLQVPGVRQLTVDKLQRVGFDKFDAILNSNPAELAAAAGLDTSLAEQIVQRFREYRRSVTAVLAEPVNSHERRRLRELVENLREQQDAFERASAGWSNEAVADKRRLRKERAQKLSDIYVVLVRLGETELVSSLEKMDVKHQLEELTRYLLLSRGYAPPM